MSVTLIGTPDNDPYPQTVAHTGSSTLAADLEAFTGQPTPDDATWTKLCESNACISVRAGGANVLIRSGADSVTLIATREEWAQFLADVKAGKLDHL